MWPSFGRRMFSSFFFFSSRRRHTRCSRDWSSDVCSSDLEDEGRAPRGQSRLPPGVEEDADALLDLQPPCEQHLVRRPARLGCARRRRRPDRKSTRLNSSHGYISYAVFCLKKKTYN